METWMWIVIYLAGMIPSMILLGWMKGRDDEDTKHIWILGMLWPIMWVALVFGLPYLLGQTLSEKRKK